MKKVIAMLLMLCMVLGMSVVASAAEVTVNDAAELATAISTADTIVLGSDLVIDTETFTIADGKSLTLNMNGKKITVTDNKASGNYELFYIYGGLTVTGNGTIELTATTDRDWNAMSTIFHNRGGVLTIENGTFKNLGGTDMAWVIDNSGNYYGDATTNINGGVLECTYTAIRNRMEHNEHGASGKAILNISGGQISGTTSAIWAQAASTSTVAPATGEINISGGEIGLINTARAEGAECMTTISGGTVEAFKGEVGELTVNGGEITGDVTILTAGGEEVAFVINESGVYVKDNGTSVTAVASIGDAKYTSLQAAINAAVNGDVITLLEDSEETETVTVPAGKEVTIDLNGKKVSMIDSSNATAALIKNNGILTIKDTSAEGTGTLTFKTDTPSAANAYASNTISNYGVITIESGIIENTSVGGGACYALDNYAGSTATIVGGKLVAEKTTVRIFNWTEGDAAKATLNVKGGEILSKDGYGINLNMGNAPQVELNISGGTITTEDTDYDLAVYVVSKGSAENVGINVTGGIFNGTFALNGLTSTTMGENKISISGGTFDGIFCYDEPAYEFITGGNFTALPEAEYAEEGTVLEIDGTEYLKYNGEWVVVVHKDTDFDHKCNCALECERVYGTCKDADFDHACDYGCDKVFGEHKDSAEDKDHICDYCKSEEVLEECTSVTDAAKAPTCTETGLTEGSHCSVCEKVLVAQETVPALEHKWGKWFVAEEPTYTEEGVLKRVCENDATHVERKAIAKLVPDYAIETKGPDASRKYVITYLEDEVIVPEGLENKYPTSQDVKDALAKEAKLKGELFFREVSVGYLDAEGNFVPMDNDEFFKDGKEIFVLLKYPEGYDRDDNFEVLHLKDDGTIENCKIEAKTVNGLLIKVDSLSPFVINCEKVEKTFTWKDIIDIFDNPSTEKPETVKPADKEDETNPNTGAPVMMPVLAVVAVLSGAVISKRK